MAVKNKKIKELDPHFRPQWCLAMVPLVEYTHIVHLENFNTEFRPIINFFKLPGEPKDYTWNEHATGSSDKLTYFYDQDCINLVKEIYEKDFDYFSYKKDFL